MALATVVRLVWEVIKDRDRRLVHDTLKGWAQRLWEWTESGQYLDGVGGTGIGCAIDASLEGALADKGSGSLWTDP